MIQSWKMPFLRHHLRLHFRQQYRLQHLLRHRRHNHQQSFHRHHYYRLLCQFRLIVLD
jgi:hypothetical protein